MNSSTEVSNERAVLKMQAASEKYEYLTHVKGINFDSLYNNFVNNLGRELASILYERHKVPILFYGKLNNVRLADIRKKLSYFDSHTRSFQAENDIKEVETDLFGKVLVNPQIGVICLGAVPFILNYNIRLNTTNKGEASKITKGVREKDGGLPHVEALTLQHHNGNMEVACNLLNPPEIGPEEVINRVKCLLSEINDDRKDERESTFALEIEKAYVTGLTEGEVIDKLFNE